MAIWITAVIAPVVLIVAGLIGDVVRARLITPQSAASPAVPVGDTVQPPSTDWAERAYDALAERVTQERAEHAQCHAVMREHDLPIPHD